MKLFKIVLIAGLLAMWGVSPASAVVEAVKTFNIVDYGAKPDGKTFATQAIQAAIDACHEAGGGEVVFPEGTFLSATVYLKDHVTLRLEKGAMLLGSNRIADYPEHEQTGTRIEDFLSRSLIFARARSISGL